MLFASYLERKQACKTARKTSLLIQVNDLGRGKLERNQRRKTQTEDWVNGPLKAVREVRVAESGKARMN